MKAVVQNPIQSLPALGCHLFSGRATALPLIFTGLILIVLSVDSLQAQSRDTGIKPDNDARLELLFDQIMETLPEEKRSRVDSAGAASRNPRPDTPEAVSGSRDHEPPSTSARLRELPQDLKVQVERVIADIEQRKEQRKERFRESRQKK